MLLKKIWTYPSEGRLWSKCWRFQFLNSKTRVLIKLDLYNITNLNGRILQNQVTIWYEPYEEYKKCCNFVSHELCFLYVCKIANHHFENSDDPTRTTNFIKFFAALIVWHTRNWNYILSVLLFLKIIEFHASCYCIVSRIMFYHYSHTTTSYIPSQRRTSKCTPMPLTTFLSR
jgi:hypothetical protein